MLSALRWPAETHTQSGNPGRHTLHYYGIHAALSSISSHTKDKG